MVMPMQSFMIQGNYLGKRGRSQLKLLAKETEDLETKFKKKGKGQVDEQSVQKYG